MLEEWRDGIWQRADFSVWDVSHYESGREYAARERAAILKVCQGLMSWCVISMFCIIYVLRLLVYHRWKEQIEKPNYLAARREKLV